MSNILEKVTTADIAKSATGAVIEQSKGLAGSVRTLATLGRDSDTYKAPAGTDGRGRFKAAAVHYRATPEAVRTALRNTYRGFFLHGGLCLAAIAAGVTVGGWMATGPAIIFAVFALRASVANWILRRQSADGIGAYLRSLDYLPKKA